MGMYLTGFLKIKNVIHGNSKLWIFFKGDIKLCHKTVEKKLKHHIQEHESFKLNLSRQLCSENGGQNAKNIFEV